MVSALAYSQGNKPDSKEVAKATAIRQVNAFLNSDRHFISSSITNPVYSLGDSAAVAAKSIIGNKPVTPQQAADIVTLIDMAFSTPRVIRNTSDRKPTAAKALLESLEAGSLPAETVDRIEMLKQNFSRLP